MARVYLALATGLAGFTKLAVLKVMRDELAKNPEAVQLFLGEARLAARFNHPNVVQTTELGEDAGRYFICMEYLEGLPLSSLLGKTQSERLPLAARLEIVCQLLDGLQYLHELTDLRGKPLCLVHRDISPSNVFVTFEGAVKILDFGVAKATGVTEESQDGGFQGKLGYAAPEQMLGQLDARSDIYTTGLLLWELLSYQRLRRSGAYADVVHGGVTGTDAFTMRSLGHGIPEPLLEICAKAAAGKLEDRYQFASALRDALRSYAAEHSLQYSPEQLRSLLAERFDTWRGEVRKNIARELKAVELEGVDLTPADGQRSRSQTPHPFAVSPLGEGPLGEPRLVKRARPWPARVSGAVLVLVAAFIGASLVSREERSSAAAANARDESSPAWTNASVVDLGHPNAEPTTVGPSRVLPLALVEKSQTAEPRAERRRRDGSSTRGGAAAKASSSRESPTPSPSARRALDPRPATKAPDEPYGLVHSRRPAVGARPIDTSSPYSK